MKENLDVDKVLAHWLRTSEEDFNTMEHLLQSRDYHWALFMGHIVVEKLLKACVVKNTGGHAPFTHDLSRLAKISQIEFTSEHLDWMDTITRFNMNARL